MAEPPRRTLWYDFCYDTEGPFSVDCTVGVDTIDSVKKMIHKDNPHKVGHLSRRNLHIYSHKGPSQQNVEWKDLVLLNPQEKILSDFPPRNDPYPGIFVLTPLSPNIEIHHNLCTRDKTVSQLADIIDTQTTVYVHGTPASGKSALSILLRDHYRRQCRMVYWISSWDQHLEPFNGDDYRKKLAEIVKRGCPEAEEDEILANKNVIIVDEALTSDGDTEFWNGVIKDTLGYGLKFCLFCSYGNPSTATPESNDDNTPMGFSAAQYISFTPSSEPGSPPIGLFYNKDEFKVVVKKLCSSDYPKFTLDDGAQEYLFDITNGHPGAVSSMVSYFYEVFRSDLKHGRRSATITESDIVWALGDDEEVFDFLKKSTPVCRSLPSPENLTVKAMKTLSKTLRDGYIWFDQSDSDIRLCYEKGWIHKHLTRKEGGRTVCVLPSRVHEKYVEYLTWRLARLLDDAYGSTNTRD